MFKILIILILFTETLFAQTAEPDFSDIESTGRQLADLVRDKDDRKLSSFANGKAVKQFLKNSGCKKFKYKAYVTSRGDEMTVHLIADKKYHAVVGRHYSGPLLDNTVPLDDLHASTVTCLDLGPGVKQKMQDGLQIASFTTTHFEALPNAYHVMQNLLTETPLYVLTAEAIFKIEDGAVNRVENDKQ